jgi:hypothetical protein
LLFALLLLAALGIALGGIRWQAEQQMSPADAARAKVKANFAQIADSIEGHSGAEAAQSGQAPREEDLSQRADYWTQRVTYPTGQYDPAWLLQAAVQDKQIESRVPAGQTTYQQERANGSLALNPSSWVPLGPAPAQSDGCWSCFNFGLVGGRVNDIAIDPVISTTAYIATVGGGVWKSTNCCAADTGWTSTINDPLINEVGISDLAIDPHNHNTIYAGTGEQSQATFGMGSAGLLKSTNGGQSWTTLGADVFNPRYPSPPGQFPQYQAIIKVVVDPRNSNNVIAGTKTGVFFSYDAGSNWSGPCIPDAFPDQHQEIYGLIGIDNGTGTTLYAAVGNPGIPTPRYPGRDLNGANGIYTTTVGLSGCPASWNLITRPDNGWPVGTGSGIPHNVANGNPLGRIDIDVAPSNHNVIYAQVQNPAPQATCGNATGCQLGVWRSVDGGLTWQQRSDSNTLNASTCGFDYNQNWYDQGIRVDPNNPDVVYMDTYDIWKSLDGGTNFFDITCGYGGGDIVHVDQHALEFRPGSSDVLMAGSDGGVYSSNSASQIITETLPITRWVQLNSTLNTIEFYSGDTTGNFATGPNPGANGGSQDNGSFVTTWNSPAAIGPQQWQLRQGGDGFWGRTEPVLGQRWYQTGNNGNMYVSTTGPYGPLMNVSGGWLADTRSFIFPSDLYKYDCPATGCTHLIAGSNRVWETITGGIPRATAWYTNSANLTKGTLGASSYINQLSYAVSLSTTAIVGTNDGNVQYGFGLGQGTPLSATWVDVTGGNAVLPNRPILDVTTDPINPLVGYAAIGGFAENTPATPGHVYRVTCTANCGSFTWVNKSGNLPNIPIDSIIANPRYPQQVFAGSDWGVYYTNDITAASPTWFRFDTGMRNAMIWDMTIDRGYTTLSVWTRGSGAYVWPLPAGSFVPPTVTPTVTGTPPTATAVPSATATPSAPPCPVYTVMTSTATIVPGVTDSGNHCDDCATTVSLPFPVQLYDQTFTQAFINSNGSLEFGAATASNVIACLPDRNNTYIVYAYQTDLCTADCGGVPCPTCGVFTNVTGTAPNRDFVVEWRTILYGANVPANFEIVLHENSSTISTIYGVTGDQGANEVAGIQKTASSTWTQYSCGEPSLTNGLRVDYVLQPCATPTATATATAPAATATPVNCPLPFTDVDQFNPFYQYIQCLYCRGIISGYADNTFRWTADVTRGQVSKIIANSAGFNDTVTGQTFTDVGPGNPFYVYIERLYRHGDISGYDTAANCPSGVPCFRWELPVTRGQMAKIDANAAGYTETPTGQTFRDVPPSQTFYQFIERLSLHGVISGYTCGGPGEPCPGLYYRPNANITRGQVSKVAAQTFFPNACAPAQR